MRRAAILGVLVVCGCVAISGAVLQRVRYDDSGRLIAELLQPDDAVVIIDRESEGAHDDAKLTLEAALRDLTRSTDAVVLADVTDASSELVDSGRWIDTRLTGTVTEVVGTRRVKLAAGQRIAVTVRGGEKAFGDVLVRAGVFKRGLPVGRYLLFVFRVAEGLLALPFLLKEERVASIWREDLISEDGGPRLRNNVDTLVTLAGMPIDELVQRIRQVR